MLDFDRNDYVWLYLEKDGKLVQSAQTGYLVSNSEKNMPRGNAIELLLETDQEYVLYVKIVNEVTQGSLNAQMLTYSDWAEIAHFKTLKNVAFMAILVVMVLYTLLHFFQSKNQAYLYFGLYLITVFLSFSFVTEMARDYVVTDNPRFAFIFLAPIVLAPASYYGFASRFLNTFESYFLS